MLAVIVFDAHKIDILWPIGHSEFYPAE